MSTMLSENNIHCRTLFCTFAVVLFIAKAIKSRLKVEPLCNPNPIGNLDVTPYTVFNALGTSTYFSNYGCYVLTIF